MVKDSARKKAARAYAHQTGQSYTASARETAHPRADGGVSAYQAHIELVKALRQAGWPVEYEDFPEHVEYRSYPGPARVTVGRADQVTSFGGDDDPTPTTRRCLTYPARHAWRWPHRWWRPATRYGPRSAATGLSVT